jgi:hypothetical protein
LKLPAVKKLGGITETTPSKKDKKQPSRKKTILSESESDEEAELSVQLAPKNGRGSNISPASLKPEVTSSSPVTSSSSPSSSSSSSSAVKTNQANAKQVLQSIESGSETELEDDDDDENDEGGTTTCNPNISKTDTITDTVVEDGEDGELMPPPPPSPPKASMQPHINEQTKSEDDTKMLSGAGGGGGGGGALDDNTQSYDLASSDSDDDVCIPVKRNKNSKNITFASEEATQVYRETCVFGVLF